MINFIRIITFVVAVAILFFGFFYINPEEELEKAHRAFYAGDMDQTLRLAGRADFAFKEDAGKTEALFLQAQAAIKMDWNKKAKDYLDELLSIDGNNIQALFLRGKLENKSGNYEDAIADFKRGFNLNGKVSDQTKAYYHALFGMALLSSGDLDKADEQAVKSLKLNNTLPEAHDLKSKIYEKRGDIRKALEECEKAYQMSSDRNKLFFTTPEGRELSDRLVDLRVKSYK